MQYKVLELIALNMTTYERRFLKSFDTYKYYQLYKLTLQLLLALIWQDVFFKFPSFMERSFNLM